MHPDSRFIHYFALLRNNRNESDVKTAILETNSRIMTESQNPTEALSLFHLPEQPCSGSGGFQKAVSVRGQTSKPD
jgi:hypothetical protein